jgi:hypothetical protein
MPEDPDADAMELKVGEVGNVVFYGSMAFKVCWIGTPTCLRDRGWASGSGIGTGRASKAIQNQARTGYSLGLLETSYDADLMSVT